MRTARPKLRITCAACKKVVASKADVYIVDDEWVRRFSGAMSGHIVCRKCSFLEGSCKDSDGGYVRHHISVAQAGKRYESRSDFDLWSHVLQAATQRAAADLLPADAVRQGGRDWFRFVANDLHAKPRLREWAAGALAAGRRV